MRVPLKAVCAAALGLILQAQSASAGDSDCCDSYPLYVERYVSRTYSPVYDCPRTGCGTHIRLQRGSHLDAACWDGWEGWCEIRSRHLKNMFVPRYALDNPYGGYGGYRHKSYGYKKDYRYDHSYKHGGYKYGGYKDGGYKDGGYKDAGYGHSAYSYKEHGYAPYKDKGYGHDSYDHGYKHDPYKKGGYGYEPYGKGYKDGYKHTAYNYGAYDGNGYKNGPYKHTSYGQDSYGGDDYKHGSYKSIGYGHDSYGKGDKHGGYYGESGYKHGGYYEGGHGYEKKEKLYDGEHDDENGEYEE